MTKRDEFDARLERLAARTAALAAQPGLTERVMDAVERDVAERSSWAARGVVLGVLAAAAAAAIWISSAAQSELDGRALSAFDTVELEQ